MAKVVTITNPVTGQPAQVDQLDHTAQQIDDAVEAARWSHRNLLDNAYWANPDAIIDQRGGRVVKPGINYRVSPDASIDAAGVTDKYYKATYYTGNWWTIDISGTTYYVYDGGVQLVRGYVEAGYTIDRFYKESNGVVLIEDDGITIDASGGTTVFIQNQSADFINSLLGKTVTLSVLLTNNTLLTGTGTFPDTLPTSTNVGVCSVSSNGIVIQTVLFGAAKSYQLFRCTVHDGVTKKICAAKLELGTIQTLAHQDENGNWVLNDPPPDKGEELAKCQRYLPISLSATSGSRMASGTFVAISETEALGTIETPVSPRANGAAVFNEMYLYRNGRFAISKFNYLIANGTGFYASIVSTGLTVGNVYKLMTGSTGGSLLISCEL